MSQRPRIVTCQGGSAAAQLAADVARELESSGVTGPVLDLARTDADSVTERATIALDGCAGGCGSRLAAARGVQLVAALDLEELGVSGDEVESVDAQALAARVSSRLGNAVSHAPSTRSRRYGPSRAATGGQAHTVEDYLFAIDALTSPIVECGVRVSDAPTLASHVSEVLGVSRASAGEMLQKMESSGLVRRGRRKELLLSSEGRARADASVRRQRLLEVFASRFLGYEIVQCYERARLLGGSFDDDAISRLERRLEFPERCPHGWQVEPARAREESSSLRTLQSLRAGAWARVALLPEDDAETLRVLAEHDLRPGTELTVTTVTATGGVCLDMQGRGVVLDGSTCRAVLVSPASPSARDRAS